MQAALDKMQLDNPRTTLVAAHRLETIKNCDKIVVLDKGGVKEEGTHSELLELNGVYHGLWMKQGGASLYVGCCSECARKVHFPYLLTLHGTLLSP